MLAVLSAVALVFLGEVVARAHQRGSGQYWVEDYWKRQSRSPTLLCESM